METSSGFRVQLTSTQQHLEPCRTTEQPKGHKEQVGFQGQVQKEWRSGSIQGLTSCKRLCTKIWHRLQQNLFSNGEIAVNSYTPCLCHPKRLATTSDGCCDCFSQWDIRRGDLHATREIYTHIYTVTFTLLHLHLHCYTQPGKEHLVCKLKRSLYGLKQSPRCWNKVFTQFMKTIGFTQSTADPCIYVHVGDGLSIIALYVDDLIIASKTDKEMKHVKELLQSQFKMTDMGELHYCLGIAIIHRFGESIELQQKHYILKMIEKYNMGDAKVVSTPADPNVRLCKDDGVSKNVDPVLYQSIVGSLLYAAMATRPDTSQAVGLISKFSAKPTKAHLTAAKWIIRYLKGTSDTALRYKKSDEGQLIRYSDADFAGDLNDQRSTSSHVFFMSQRLISWSSKKQPIVTLSTAEAEYVALSYATQEATWTRRLLSDFHVSLSKPMVIMEDNQGAISIARNPVTHSRTKHNDIRYHYIREAVDANTIDLKYCPTEDMNADIMTKPLPKTRFSNLCSKMGLVRSTAVD